MRLDDPLHERAGDPVLDLAPAAHRGDEELVLDVHVVLRLRDGLVNIMISIVLIKQG